MNIPEEFGNYLLLKKLAEDALGETFRAGRVGKDGVDQVVLLRVYNGKGLNLERIGVAVNAGAPVQAALKSPNIGNGVDLGTVRNYPYTAYDYISGKSLAKLLAKARAQHSPIPTDHALLIAERLSLALSAAYESRVRDERILHGFVVPELVMVSNEGETRLLGFEVGPALRDCAASGWRDDSVSSYVAPEVAAGAPMSKQDDTFALGAILFELLTGEHLPRDTGGGYDGVIDQAALASDGAAIPAPVAALLKKSLAPRDQRIGDALVWHKGLAKLMIDGHFSPTTFNLAFFMHSLFRDDIERENQELQAEKKIDLQKASPAAKAAAASAAKPATAPVAPVRESTLAGASVAPMAAAAKGGSGGGKGALLGGLAALLLLGGGAAWYFLLGPGKGGAAPSSVAPPAATTDVATPGAGATTDVAAGAPAASQAEIEAQIQAMFEARSKEMEAKLKDQYDQRIKQLQGQLEESKRTGAEPSRPTQTAQIPSAPPPAEEPKPVQRQEPPPAQASPPVSAPVSAPPPAPVPETKPAAPAPAPVQERRQPQTQVGDLVRLGEPGVVNARLLSRIDPPYPASAQKLNRAAQVDIKVLVDEKGQVVDAERIGQKAGLGFDEAALAAAKRSVFQPATKDGVRVKIWYTMRMTFKAKI